MPNKLLQNQDQDLKRDFQVVNRALRVLSACTQAVIRATDEMTLLQTLCQLITEEAAYRMAWVGYVCHDEGKTVQPVAWAGYEAEYLKDVNITWADTERGQGPTGRAIRSHQPIACQNMLKDPSFAPWREAAQQRGYQSSLVLPLFNEDKVFATLNIYSVEADAFNQRELALLIELADSLSFGILALRAKQKQQQAEAALRLSEEKFSKAFYSSPVANCIITLENGLILDVNHGFEWVFGYDREEAIGHTTLELQMWQDLADRQAMLQQLQTQGNLRDYEAKLQKHHGEKFLCLISAETIEVGENICILAAIEDITERRQAELTTLQLNEELEQRVEERTAALRKSEQRYRALMDGACDAILVADTQGNLLEANQKALEMLGYTEVELLQLHASKLHPPQDVDKAMQAFAGMAKRETDRCLDVLVVRKDGRCFPAEITGTSIDLGDETVLWGNFRDITERKQAQAALQRSQEFLRLITDSLPVCIVYLDTEQRYQFVNHTYEVWFNRNREEILGKPMGEIIDPQVYATIQGYLDRALAGETVTYEQLFGQEGITQNCFQISILPDWNHDRQVQGCFVMLVDITNKKLVEQELKRSNQELEQFAYVASHDLQEPLRAVTGYTQLLMSEYGDHFDETAQSYAEFITDGTKRMQLLIQDLLTYSRVGTRGKEFALTDCNSVVKEALRNLQVAIEESHAEIIVEPLPSLKLDRSQLVQLFQNLISNSIKFCEQEHPRIQIRAIQRQTDFLFQVEDNGIGIKPQYLERIFEVFKRLHTRREYSGTGIGLAICKKIVLRHGGQIWAESTPNLGTTFCFTIPDRHYE
ncbi:PAS domain S-box protein [Floridanema fluviatile]|uniref:GAF domain-containing sensor histidine kinase n=1 Tax=Floridanema fluviatile TaxID=3396171 RepID=UPI0039A6CBB9